VEKGFGRQVNICGARVVDLCGARKQCCFCQRLGNFVDSAKEIHGNMSDNGKDSEEDPTMKLEALKAENQN